MNSKRSKLMQVMIIVVVMMGLLAAAWPGMAQGDKPPFRPEMKRFLEERVREPQRFKRLSLLSPSSYKHAEVALASQGPSPVWTNEVLENNPIGWRISFALDKDNHPHISYQIGGAIKYAYRDTQWHIETIATSDTNTASIAVDSHSRPYISFKSSSDLKLVTYDGLTWRTETVDTLNSSGSLGEESFIALDATDRPHIGYDDPATNHLKYAYFDGTQWQIESINTNGDYALISSMALDKLGWPHITYCVYSSVQQVCNGLKYAYKNSLGWHIQTVDNTGYATGASIAIDVNNRLHLSYFHSPSSDYYNATLKYGIYNGSAWSFQDLTNSGSMSGGSSTSLQFDKNGDPHILYNFYAMFSNGQSKYTYFDGTSWKTLDLPFGVNLAGSAVLQLDIFSHPHIAYANSIGFGAGYASLVTDINEWSSLAFASYRDNNWEIYTSKADGTNQARRTVNSADDSTPKFNRGANRLVFVSNRDGNNETYVMNADGSGQTRLTNTAANEYWPAWSPDGSKIAFYSYRDGNAEIYVMNANGSNQTPLTSNAAWDGHPAWSPDGTQIVFVSERSGADDLWIMNANGTNQHQLTFGLNAAYPDWSPDGSRIIFNDDTNNDGWLDIATINADGGNLSHPLGYSPANYDYTSPSWSPSGQDYAFAKIQWIYYQGNYYWVDAYLYGVSAGSVYQLTSSGLDWWPDWQTTDVWPPSSQVNALPALLNTPQFTVEWSGTDTGVAGIMSYDIQYRDGLNGTWTTWLTATSQTSVAFSGQYGHAYYFRSRARDYANNLESYPTGNGDAWTTVYQYTATGQVYDNREQPVAVANVQANPSALNTGFSRHDGAYDLYFATGGVYTLTTTRSRFGQLPPLLSVTVPSSNSLLALFLPPFDNQINDSHFESDSLSVWNPSGDLTPTITSTAHTGLGAVVLGGSVPADTVTVGPWHSTLEQTINVSPTIVSGTLSLLYRVDTVEPLSDTFIAYVMGASNMLTFTLPVTASEWTHAWFDLSAWTEPTATVKIDFAIADTGREATVILDEITWGSAIEGSHAVFLPITRR